MNSASYRQHAQEEALAMPMSAASPWNRFANTMADTRTGLIIIGYELALRVLVLARRWNY
jgi:hypothetical protein